MDRCSYSESQTWLQIRSNSLSTLKCWSFAVAQVQSVQTQQKRRFKTNKDKQEVGELKTLQTTEVFEVEPFWELIVTAWLHLWSRGFASWVAQQQLWVNPSSRPWHIPVIVEQVRTRNTAPGILSSWQDKTNKAPSILETNHTFPNQSLSNREPCAKKEKTRSLCATVWTD